MNWLKFMLQKDDFTAISTALRKYLPEKDTPYVLDIDLDFFSTKNPFRSLHERVNLYDKLAPLFAYKKVASNDPVVSLLFKVTKAVIIDRVSLCAILNIVALYLSFYSLVKRHLIREIYLKNLCKKDTFAIIFQKC